MFYFATRTLGLIRCLVVFIGLAGLAQECLGQRTPPPAKKESLAAPPLDTTRQTLLHDASAFLYSGPNAVQVGVAPGIIDEKRVAVVRGQVLDRKGKALPGVQVRVASHPEYGMTKSREDGWFDLAINGGGTATIDYQQDGFVPVQRTVSPTWQEQVVMLPVVLTELDPIVTRVNLTQTAAPFVVATGSPQKDQDGARTAALLFPRGTAATMRMPDGSAVAIATLDVRATELTVGDEGPAAMPAALPTSSAYTYAVDFSIDQALAAGASRVDFSSPVICYVDNFLDFPAGATVPSGSYDRQTSAWLPEPNGLVIKILSVSGGLANLDITGSGSAATATQLSAIGINADERATLATRYAVNTSIWRVPVSHFSVFDFNWGVLFPNDSIEPDAGAEANSDATSDPTDCSAGDPESRQGAGTGGSIIGVDDQTLGESVEIVGTPYRLHYESDRVPGADFRYQARVRLTPATIPASLQLISVTFSVAGQSHTQLHAPAPNLTTSFQWDGQDGYGREVQGRQNCRITVDYVYEVVYRPTEGFGRPANSLTSYSVRGRWPCIIINAPGGPRPCNSINTSMVANWWSSDMPSMPRFNTKTTHLDVSLGAWDARSAATGLAGWTLSEHHAYEPATRALQFGAGGFRQQGILNTLVASTFTTSPTFSAAAGLAIAPDGSLYIASGARLYRINEAGQAQAVAGRLGGAFDLGDGLPALQARLWSPSGVALGPDGSIYFADTGSHRIRKIGSDGIMRTIAGSSPFDGNSGIWIGGFSGDNAAATAARLNGPTGLMVDAAGTVTFCDSQNRRVRQITREGIIRTVAGNGASTINVVRGALATTAGVDRTFGVAPCPSGGYFFSNSRMVFRVNGEGRISIVAGQPAIQPPGGSDGDGGPAVQAFFGGTTPRSLSLCPLNDGSLLIADQSTHRVRLVSRAGSEDSVGPINTVFGGGAECLGSAGCGDGGSTRQALISSPIGLARAPDGNVFVAQANGRIRRMESTLPGLQFGEMIVPAVDGSKAYVFDAGGKHLRTLHGLTGATLLTFGYDSAGLLVTVTDAFNNVTTIQRSASGAPELIRAPFGQTTGLVVDNSYLVRITDPAGGEWNMAYDRKGLMLGFSDPNFHIALFEYSGGRLVRDIDASGAAKTLTRSTSRTAVNGYGSIEQTDVVVRTPQGRTTTYRREVATGQFVGGPVPGGVRRKTIAPTGAVTVSEIGPSGQTVVTAADGTRTTVREEAGPRWGMLAPVVTFREVRTPAGLTQTTVAPVPTVVLATQSDPFSVRSITSTEVRNGRTTTTSYVHDTVAGTRTVTITSPAGRVQVQRFDAQGRILSGRFGNLAQTTYQYDGRGRLVGVARSDGATTRQASLAYNGQGFVASITDPAGRMKVLEYDASGRILTERLPDGNPVLSAYDSVGNSTSLSPPGSQPSLFTHSALNLVTSYTPPVAGPGPWETTYAYSPDRQLMRTTRPAGDTIDYAYNSSGLASDVLYAGGSLAVAYDLPSSCCMGSGRVVSMTRQGAGQTLANGMAFSYDGRLMTGMTYSGSHTGSVSWTYNNDFLPASESINGTSTVTYSYDADQLVTAAGAEAIVRDPQNGLVVNSSIGAFTCSRSYNLYAELTGLSYSWNAVSLASFSYVRDSLGRITRSTEVIQGVSRVLDYAYDLRGRLVGVRENSATRATYTYDSNGNRLSRTDASGVINAAYDAQDRLLSNGADSFAYTRSGELRTAIENGQATTFTYDALGALVHVAMPNGNAVQYESAGTDMRIAKMSNNATSGGWIYRNDTTPAAEVDSHSAVTKRFVFGWNQKGAPDYMLIAGSVIALVKDSLGSPRLVIDVSSGALVQAIQYDEFGQIVVDTNPSFQPFGFAGGLLDNETRLTRFGRRDYDAKLGRWMARDPALFAARDGNLYAYCQGDPVNRRDYTGLDATDCAISYGIEAGLAARISLAPNGTVTLSGGLGGSLGLSANRFGPFSWEVNCDASPVGGSGPKEGVNVSAQVSGTIGPVTVGGGVALGTNTDGVEGLMSSGATANMGATVGAGITVNATFDLSKDHLTPAMGDPTILIQ